MTSLTERAIDALSLRAQPLSQERELSPDVRAFWLGYLKALNDLRDGVGSRLASRDEAQRGLTAAGAALPVHVESFAATPQVGAPQGVEIAGHNLTDAQFNRVEQLENVVVPGIVGDSEHPPAGVHREDDRGGHRASLQRGWISLVAWFLTPFVAVAIGWLGPALDAADAATPTYASYGYTEPDPATIAAEASRAADVAQCQALFGENATAVHMPDGQHRCADKARPARALQRERVAMMGREPPPTLRDIAIAYSAFMVLVLGVALLLSFAVPA